MKNSIIFIFSFLFILSCKQTQKVIYDPSNVTIIIRNDQGNPQQGAQVRMFNDVNAYLNSKNTGEESGFTEKVISDATGSVKFNELNTDKEYYFLVNYRDRLRFLDLDNYDQEFKFSKHLSKGAETQAEIQLKPAKSIVGFYLPDSLKGYLPVKFFIDNDSIGNLTQSASNISSPNQPGLLSFRFTQGKKQWKAVSPQGCIWFGEVNVLPTENFSPVALPECNGGSLLFYIDPSNVSQLPINITLNASDNIGSLNTATSIPTECFDKKALSVARTAGIYTYTAIYERTNCVITDTVSITKAGCKMIKLPNCK